MMKVPYTKSGECAGVVWQRARYGQICYETLTPANPRSPAQVAVRGNFAMVSRRWSLLTQEQRDVWNAVARTMKSRPRLAQCGPLTGFNLFVKVNVALANRGQAQLDLPPGWLGSPKPAASSPFCISRFDQPPVASTLFLQANQRIGAWQHDPREFPALAPLPS
jgi:hypothetical protein